MKTKMDSEIVKLKEVDDQLKKIDASIPWSTKGGGNYERKGA